MSGKKRTFTVYQNYWDDDNQSWEEQEIDATVIYDRSESGVLSFRVVKTSPRAEVDEDFNQQIVEAIEGEEAAIADYKAEQGWRNSRGEK